MFTRVLRYLPYALLLALVAVLLAGSTPAFTAGNLSPAAGKPTRFQSYGLSAYTDWWGYDPACPQGGGMISASKETERDDSPTFLYYAIRTCESEVQGWGYIPSSDFQVSLSRAVLNTADTSTYPDFTVGNDANGNPVGLVISASWEANGGYRYQSTSRTVWDYGTLRVSNSLHSEGRSATGTVRLPNLSLPSALFGELRRDNGTTIEIHQPN